MKRLFLFFKSGVKLHMKHHKMTLLRAIVEEIYMMFAVMGLKLYISYANGTAFN